ncbi:hypothetical protein BH09SUM1_BH09SUM1_10230 [soil metagenome]
MSNQYTPLPRTSLIIGGAVVLWSFALVLVFAAPTFTLRDAPLFAMVAASGGIAHPPGSPAWAMLATIFLKIIPFSDAARGTNIFCGLLGSLTAGGLYLLAVRVLAITFPEERTATRNVAALLAPLILMMSPGWWAQLTETEQYTLMTALLMAIAHVGWIVVFAEMTDRRRAVWSLGLGALWGFSIGNHISQVGQGPLIVLIVFARRDGWRAGIVRLFAAGIGFAAGLMVYLWEPLRSVHDPLVDWGDVETFHNFLRQVRRDQWPPRPWSTIPPGFAMSWLESYNFFGELSIPGFLLAAGGVVVLALKRSRLVMFLAAATIPYAAVMLYGHLRQEGMDIDYAYYYGVTDWHVALYAMLACAATVGAIAGAVKLNARHALTILAVCALIFAVWSVRIGYKNSRYYGADMPAMTAAILDPAPEGALVLLASDNTAFPAGYDSLIMKRHTKIWMGWMGNALPNFITKEIAAGHEWTPQMRAAYFADVLTDKYRSPLRVPPPTPEQVLSAPLYCDYDHKAAPALKWMLPRGFLYEVRMTETTNEDILAADEEWRATAKVPAPDTSLLMQDRRGWSELYERRGLFFFGRRLYKEALAEYEVALAWMPERARLYHRRGLAKQMTGDLAGAEKDYWTALDIIDLMPGPRYNLALLVGQRGDGDRALELLETERRLDPENPGIATLEQQIRASKR